MCLSGSEREKNTERETMQLPPKGREGCRGEAGILS